MTDNPQSNGPQGPDPQNPYAQGVPAQPQQPDYSQQPPAQPVPPAQPGGYPAPAQPGGYPAAPPVSPQQPGYGQQPGAYAPPGQPSPSGYPAPYGQMGPAVSVGDAFTYGWNKFIANAGVIIGGALTWLVIFAIVSAVVIGPLFVALAIDDKNSKDFTGAPSLATALLSAIIMVVAFLAQAAMINVACVASAGRKIEFRDFFSFPNFGTVALLILAIGVVEGVLSSITFGFGSLVVGLFTQFMLFFAVDQRQGFVDSIKNGLNLVTKNFSPSILIYLVFLACVLVGSLLCGVGLIVGFPVALFATAYVYRRLIGQQPA